MRNLAEKSEEGVRVLCVDVGVVVAVAMAMAVIVIVGVGVIVGGCGYVWVVVMSRFVV